MPPRRPDRPQARVVVRKIQDGRWGVFAPSGLIGSCLTLDAAVVMAEAAAEAHGVGLFIMTEPEAAVVVPAPKLDGGEEQEDD